MKICPKCNYTNYDDGIEICEECGAELKWIDRDTYENNQRILRQFYKQQQIDKEKKERLEKYERDFRNKKISLEQIIQYRRMYATDAERKRMNQEDTAREQREKEKKEQERQIKEQCVPRCPTCQSPNIKKISNVRKAGSVALWGIFAIGKVDKTFHCNNCGYEW